MSKKALIITYYWPPSGGSGVQRWAKFTKYLPQFGWTPLIYTPENPEIPAVDHSLESDLPKNLTVLKTPIREPYSLYKKLAGEKRVGVGFIREKKRRFFPGRLFKWIRGNFFIPDARKFWIRPSVKWLSDYLSENPVDVLITTGPPHSMHLIGLELSRKFDIPWLADFRDPWTNIDFAHELKLTPRVKRKHEKLERRVLSEAGRVTVVSPTMKNDMEALAGRPVDLLTNGFDADDFPPSNPEADQKFTILHTGMMSESRNPRLLWKILAELIETESEFQKDLDIRLTGPVDVSVLDSIETFGLTHFLSRTSYLPHSEVVKQQQKARLLLLVLNDSPNARCLMPAKLFEYMAAKRPIFCIGPTNGDAADIMNLSEAYCLADRDDAVTAKSFITSRYHMFKNGESDSVDADIEAFSRFSLTGNLNSILREMTL